ncbi:alpha/beta fold hydrolase, partial [Kaarinaea lacus]
MTTKRKNKTALILGPGLMSDVEVWEPQAENLSDIADIQIADTLQDDNLPAMARRLLEKAPPIFMYAGFSMGGYLGFELLRQAPERISKLALLSTTAQPDPVEHTQLREMFIEMTEQDRFEEAVASNLSLLLTPEFNNDDQQRGAMTAMAKRVGPKAYIRQLKLTINRPDSRPTLSDVRVPTCII